MPNGRVRARVERGSSRRRHRFPRSNGFSFEDGFLEIDLDVDLDEPGCFFCRSRDGFAPRRSDERAGETV